MPSDLETLLPVGVPPQSARTARDRETISLGKIKLQLTPVFYEYWRFAAERQRLFFRRLSGFSGVLTDDQILRCFKYTNAYRASDRVSQYLIRNVIYRSHLPSDEREVFFRTI